MTYDHSSEMLASERKPFPRLCFGIVERGLFGRLLPSEAESKSGSARPCLYYLDAFAPLPGEPGSSLPRWRLELVSQRGRAWLVR